jgi:hypothetical protein
MRTFRPWLGDLGRWWLILAQALFLIVIVPGHTRGMIRLSGKAPPGGHALMFDSCCAPSQPVTNGGKTQPMDRSDCAICAIAVALTAAIVLVLLMDFLGVARIWRGWVEWRPSSLAVVRVYQGRGPPAI